MKRYLAYLLVAVMVLSLCACGADNQPADQTTVPSAFGSEPTNGTSGPETPTDTPTVPTLPSDPVPDATVPSEDNTADSSDPTVPSEPSEVVKPTEPSEPVTKPTTPTNPTKPSETTKPTNPTKPSEPKPTVPTEPKPITPTVPTTPTKPSEPSEPTVPSKPTEPTPTVPTPPDEEDEPVVEEPYFVKMELVSVERPNAHYIDGVDMLTYMFGKNKALQKGDSVTYRIVMSDGGTSGFGDFDAYGFDYSVKGNLLTITADGTAQNNAWVTFVTTDKNGNTVYEGPEWRYIIDEDGDISDGQGKMAHLLKRYAKFLGFTVKDGAQMTGYTTNTGGTMESLTGCTIKDNDDQIDIPGNSNWIKEVVWLFGEYKKLGFSNVAFYVIYADSFASVAD